MFGFSNSGVRELFAMQAGVRRGKRVHLSRRFRQRIFWRDGGLCRICDQPVKFVEMTLDHVTPLTKGGATRSKENYICAHQKCNAAKGPLEFESLDDLGPDQLAQQFYDVTERAKRARGHYAQYIQAVT